MFINLTKSIIFFLLFFVPISNSDDEIPKITSVYLDRPIWALGLEDANWLLPSRDDKTTIEIALFSFSGIKKKDKLKEPKIQPTGSLGRTTRSLPLFLGERINIETSCQASNYLFVVENVGSVLAGVPYEIEDLLKVFGENKPDYIVTGHIVQDYFDYRTNVELEFWDVKTKKIIFKLNKSKLFNDPVDAAAILPKNFFSELKNKNICQFHNKYKTNYPAPMNNLVSHYMDGLGQLFAQTIAENKLVDPNSLYGEDDMLDWYLTLWEHMPNSDATKLIFFKGILSSIKYGGEAHKKYIPQLKNYIEFNNNQKDVITLLSPLLYSKMGNESECKIMKKKLLEKDSEEYKKWLNSINCNTEK